MRIRSGALPGGRMLFTATVAALGAIFVVGGLALVPLPGPGWAIVIFGLAIWAIEFVWARHLLDRVRRWIRAWTDWVKRQPLPVRILLGTAVLAVSVVVVWLWIKHRYGFESAGQFLRYVLEH